MARGRTTVEWPTLLALVLCYAVWAAGVVLLSAVWLPAALVVTAAAAAFHSSLQHEIIHHHPFRNDRINECLVTPALSLFIPYRRFRDTHLAHHTDDTLTDPYDDPESNYVDPKVWGTLPGWVRAALRANNTLLGRMLIGPLVSQVAFIASDWQAVRSGDRAVRNAWLWHIPAVAVVIWAVGQTAMPLWAYAIAAYAALSLLKIRTYLEHRAHNDPAARTVIVEDSGPLSVLFLNNNLHVVHHAHPGVPWYALPALYRARRDAFLDRNRGYRYASYGEVFARHLLAAKDPVPHPMMPPAPDVSDDANATTEPRGDPVDAPAGNHPHRDLHAQ